MEYDEFDEEITIRNCTFAYKCTAKWDDMSETEDEKIKFCQSCQQEVVYCETDEELVVAVKRNKCVSIVTPYSNSQILGMPALKKSSRS